RSGLLSVERKRGAGNVYTVNPQLLNTLEHALNERLEAHRQEAKEKKEQRLYGEHKAEAEQWEQVTHIVTLPDFKAEEIEW
ncbi:TPA: hypothetical protein QHB92_000207, partial [Klebsiella quasipneumoniae subsp. similipneumoniae]|nr:hypothetical protein [Klebsiella quasipneumoniae subsp. similipneumoniae]